MRTVGLFEAKNKLSELANAAAGGEDVLITRHGKPLVKLVAVQDAVEAQKQRQRDTMEDIKALRSKLKYRMTIEEILEARHAGHKY
jgi:prevent-host-death family protein